MGNRAKWIGRAAGMCGLAGVVGALAAPLWTFDMLMPKDIGAVRIANGISYGAGPRQKLDVYAPRGFAPAKRLPIVIFFYGGSWASGFREGYDFVGRALAAQGFLVVIPDYRIGPDNHYPDFVEDGAQVVRWTAAHGEAYGGLARCIVVSGHSAGAYIAAMVALDTRWLGKDRGMIKGLIGIAGPYDFAPFDVPASIAAFGQWPRPEETQPVTWAGKGAPPTLLMVGEEDKTVRSHNSDALAAKLQAAQVPVTVRRYAAIGHVGMVTAIARPFRFRAPIVADLAQFTRSVTAKP